MLDLKRIIFCSLILVIRTTFFSQSIEIISYSQNPLEVSPLLGANLELTIQYSSESGATNNHIYIGLEELDNNNNFVKTIAEVTLENQTSGQNLQLSVPLFIASLHKLSKNLPSCHYYQAKAILYKSGTWTENAWAGYWNTPALVLENNNTYNFSTKSISKGADISWMTEMESFNFTWKDNNGNQKELMPLLKEYDMNAVRLRVWVNPENSGANGWCDIDDLVKKATLANDAGLDIMLCIHYSDWWADPGKQNKPDAWINYSVSQLETAVANHTIDVLTALNTKSITPKWVQIGNETNDGMLWDSGKASAGGFANYAKFINAGANAVKTFDSSIKTILHLANGDNNALYRWNIDGLISNGVMFSNLDIIGLSLYPSLGEWKLKVDETYNNLLDLQTRYNKEVMMVEVGYPNDNFDVTYQFLIYMIEKTKQANGLGVFYWEPIAHNNWRSYNKGAWDADGSPSVAMDAFKNESILGINSINLPLEKTFKIFPNPSNSSVTLSANHQKIQILKIYNVHGKLQKQVTINSILKDVDISTLATGVYFFKADGFVVKFIKN